MLHLNDNLYSKSCVFLWVANFWGLTVGFASLSTLTRAFIVGHICITKTNGAFTQGGVYPYLLIPGTYFHFHVYNRAILLDVVPPYRAHQIKHQNAVLILTMHSHPFHAMSPCMCNAMCHFMSISCHIYDECYIDNSTHASHPCIMNNYINEHKKTITHLMSTYLHTYININKSSPIKQ